MVDSTLKNNQIGSRVARLRDRMQSFEILVRSYCWSRWSIHSVDLLDMSRFYRSSLKATKFTQAKSLQILNFDNVKTNLVMQRFPFRLHIGNCKFDCKVSLKLKFNRNTTQKSNLLLRCKIPVPRAWNVTPSLYQTWHWGELCCTLNFGHMKWPQGNFHRDSTWSYGELSCSEIHIFCQKFSKTT